VVGFLKNMFGAADAAKIVYLAAKTTREILKGNKE
jgi:hypothetical protein